VTIARLFIRSDRKPARYIGFEEFDERIKKLREIGKNDYIVLVSGDAIDNLHGSILVISLSEKESYEEIEMDFNRAFGELTPFYNIGDACQAFRTDEIPIILVSPGDMLGYRKK